MFSKMKLFSTILLALILNSCTSHVERDAIIGTYILNNMVGDSFSINPDGTYFNRKVQEGKTLKNLGTWELNSTGNEIVFRNFSSLTDGYGSGNWFSRIRVENNVIH